MMSDQPLPIVYQDADLVVIDKPAGLLVHRSWLAREAKVFAMQLLRDQIGQHVFPVHRLDRPTSGLLVFAKSAEVARWLSEQFAQGKVGKTYHAVVRGYLADGRLDYPLREELDKIADRQAQADKPAQAAITEYQCVQQVELPVAISTQHATSRFSLMRLQPLTGRKHQLRRHMAHLRHPIIGDTRHGDSRQNRYFRQQLGLPGLMLAATELRLPHPQRAQPLTLRIDIPAPLQQIFSNGWDAPQALVTD